MKALNLLIRWLRSKTLYGFGAVLIFWYIIHLVINSNIMPGPCETLITFIKLLNGKLLLHVTTSMIRITAAVIIAMSIGIPLGIWLGLHKKADDIMSPILYILYPIPKIAFLPLFMILFGLGNSSKIILIITIIVFQIILAVRDGIKEIPAELFYSVKALGLSQGQTCINLIIPAVLPKIISALRVSTGVSIATLFFGENFATTYGIGYFIMNCWVMADYVQMFAGITALSIMGIIIFKSIDALERKFCPWIFLDGSDNKHPIEKTIL
ncbi:MAG: ssuC [Eubacterium sp.]|jgi:NitT/TauT family transport system permease protein|nr:ssuC [Eubacterium sp.]